MDILIFVLILSVLVFAHEFGHFIVAKLTGVKVEEFGIGFPPKLLSFRRGETVYSVNLIPFGGFVRLYGEEEGTTLSKKASDASRMFIAKSRKIRSGIVIAGVAMNFLLAIFLFSVVYSMLGIPRKVDYVRVIGVAENSPAKASQIKENDIIVAVNGEGIHSNKQFIQSIEKRAGEEVRLTIKEDNTVRDVTLVPRKNPPQGEGPLGVAITDMDQYFPPLWQRPFYGAFYGLQEAWGWGKQTVVGLGSIFTSLFYQQKLPEGVAGPVGIYDISKHVCGQGTLACLDFMGVLSVNLAVLNVLPLTPLDGGKLFFIAIEALFRGRAHSMRLKIERAALLVGTVLLVLFILAVTRQDILRLFNK